MSSDPICPDVNSWKLGVGYDERELEIFGAFLVLDVRPVNNVDVI